MSHLWNFLNLLRKNKLTLGQRQLLWPSSLMYLPALTFVQAKKEADEGSITNFLCIKNNILLSQLPVIDYLPTLESFGFFLSTFQVTQG